MAAPTIEEINVAVQDVVNFMRVTDQFDDFLQEVIKRRLCVQAARESGLEVTDEELQEAADTFRRVRGLHSAPETENWLRNSQLTLEDLEEHLEENVLVYKWKQKLLEESDPKDIQSDPELRKSLTNQLLENWFEESLGGL